MDFRNRVAVHSLIGRRIFTAHAALATAMVLTGEADYEGPGVIVLTQSVRLTDEMSRPAITKIRAPHADSSTGDAGRGNTAVPRHQALHYRADADQYAARTPAGRISGYRRHIA